MSSGRSAKALAGHSIEERAPGGSRALKPSPKQGDRRNSHPPEFGLVVATESPVPDGWPLPKRSKAFSTRWAGIGCPFPPATAATSEALSLRISFLPDASGVDSKPDGEEGERQAARLCNACERVNCSGLGHVLTNRIRRPVHRSLLRGY